jgi:hypothetical protein
MTPSLTLQVDSNSLTQHLSLLSWVLLVALIALLVYILMKRMAAAVRKHETQGMFTEFATERDERKGATLRVKIRIPASVEVTCHWEHPDGRSAPMWTRTMTPGEHTLEFDLSEKPAGRNSYRLVTPHQVLQRFVQLP